MMNVSFEREFKPATFRTILTKIQSDIVKRTVVQNTDLEGAPLASYSDRYARGKVTLVNTGWMLSHWAQKVTVREGKIVGITTPKGKTNPAQNGQKNEYSFYVDMGTDDQPQRHFVGLTDQQEKELCDNVLDPIFAKLFEGWLQSQFESDSLLLYDQEVRKIVRESNKAWREARMLIRVARAQKDRMHKIYFGSSHGEKASQVQKIREQYRSDRAALASGQKIK